MHCVIEYFAKALKVIRNNTLKQASVSPYQYSNATMSVSHTISEIFSIKEWHELRYGLK